MNIFTLKASRNILLILACFSHSTFANTPAEMADLSLQELFALSTDEMDEKTFNHWQINFLYKRSNVDRYLDGSSKVSKQDVLFDGVEARTNKNFPILPTVISQEVYIGNISYFLSPEKSISVSIPYIIQSTDHDSIVPDYDHFNISSDGLGDITLNYSALLSSWKNKKITFSAGISVPSGSIDEKGDTPRAAGDQQLPYTMQLGSGTWDFPLGLSYSQDKKSYSWGANIFTKFNTGKNDRNYRLGNRIALSVWKKWYLNSTVHPFAKIVYQNWGRIIGQDNDLLISNPSFPYPAGITNPKFYGGKKINLVTGGDIFLGSQKLSIEIGVPVYQNLNGVQPKENLHFSLSWNTQL